MRQNYIYTRSSTEGQSPELQLSDIESLHPPHDAIVIREQQSAWKDNVKRPELDHLIGLIKSRKIDTLFVWSLDRLYRNRIKLKSFLALCHSCGVKVVSYRQQWLQQIQTIPAPWNDIVYDLMLSVIGWLAEDESSLKSDRVKMAVRKKETGTYSYKGKRWGRKPFPKQTQTRVLQLHSEGKSIREIADTVQVYDNNNNGRKISKSAVHKILKESAVEKHSISNCPKND